MGARPGVAFIISAQDDASLVLKKVEAEASRAQNRMSDVGRTAGGEGAAGLRKFQTAVGNLGLATIGINGPLGKLTEGLSLLSIGNPTFLAITGGLAAIGAALALLKSPADDAKKKVDELIQSLLTADDTSIDAQIGQINKRRGEIYAQLKQENDLIVRAQQRGQQYMMFGSIALQDAVKRVQQLNGELVRTQAAIDVLEQRRPGAARTRGGGGASGREVLSHDADWNDPLAILRQINRGAEAPAAPFRVTAPTPTLINPRNLQIPEPVELTRALNLRAWAKGFADEVSGMLGDALSDGLTRAFSAAFTGAGVGGFFKQIGATLLSMLGRVFTDIGKAMVAASKLFAAVRTALLTLNPGASLAAGIGLIALGSVLGAAAGAVGGLDRGGRGGFVSAPGGSFGGGFSAGTGPGLFGKPGSIVVNFTGRGPDFTDPDERDRFARMIEETGAGGTRQVTFHRIG